MLDPFSIAGISLAALDQLLKLGERTLELVNDSRAFDDDTRKLSSKIADENQRTSLLRGLLFSEAQVYGNKTLFEQFEPDIQKQIQLLLGPLKGILQEGCDLLERRYGVHEQQQQYALLPQTSNLSLASTLTPNAHSPSQRSKSPSLPDYFRWSFQDKKRVKAIVDEVGDQNNRVHEKIKLWCLASQLGVNVLHLQRLQQDTISRQLGFDVDATLRLTQWDALNAQASLELTDPSWNQYLKPIKPMANQGKFATFTKDKITYVHEGHDYEIEARSPSDTLDSRTRKKVDDLAKILHQPKEQVFRIPRCEGWKFMPMQKSIGFVFEMPSTPDAQPISLLRLLSKSEVKPELGDKFRLALNLARCIAQLHMVKWVSMASIKIEL
jgi:Prion-inhibition and propagation